MRRFAAKRLFLFINSYKLSSNLTYLEFSIFYFIYHNIFYIFFCIYTKKLINVRIALSITLIYEIKKTHYIIKDVPNNFIVVAWGKTTSFAQLNQLSSNSWTFTTDLTFRWTGHRPSNCQSNYWMDWLNESLHDPTVRPASWIY